MSKKAKPHSGEFYVNAASANGLDVRMGKGDHCIIKGPADRGYMVVPAHAELAKGTECAIKKWLAKCGVLLTLIGGLIWMASVVF